MTSHGNKRALEILERLNNVNNHLRIATAELNKIAGSGHSYIGSLREFKKLVKAKLLVEEILTKAQAGYTWELKKHTKMTKAKPALSKEKLDIILMSLLGRENLVKAWWDSPNRAFNFAKPAEIYALNPEEVSAYLVKQTSGDYS